MDAALAWLNACSASDATEAFRGCCGSRLWAEQMAAARPFADRGSLHVSADAVFDSLTVADWDEALESHPRIGDLESLRMKYAGNRQWSAGEQSGVSAADEAVLRELSDGNQEYERRFGRTFIVCATGKSASQMLGLLKERMSNDPDGEFKQATAEQRKITRLRLDKLAAPDR